MTGPYRQHRPRRITSRPGEGPPWLADPGRIGQTISLAAVARALGDFVVPSQPSAESVDDLTDEAPSSAVLVPIYEEAGQATVILIRRSPHLNVDPIHMAFPGGRIEPGETPRDAALREAEEEIGLSVAAVGRVIFFGLAERASGRQKVAVFIGLLDEPPTLSPSVHEVDEMFAVPIVALLADGVAWSEYWRDEGVAERNVRHFADPITLQDNLVWGLTARILWDVLTAIVAANASPDAPGTAG